jgi:peroxiredoxin Q/BCP
MVSLDTAERNREFAESLGARHTLLSDPTGATARAYGVAGFAGLFARRWTFYIDRDGAIRHIDKEVSTTTAGRDIARRLELLHFPRRRAGALTEVPRGR